MTTQDDDPADTWPVQTWRRQMGINVMPGTSGMVCYTEQRLLDAAPELLELMAAILESDVINEENRLKARSLLRRIAGLE